MTAGNRLSVEASIASIGKPGGRNSDAVLIKRALHPHPDGLHIVTTVGFPLGHPAWHLRENIAGARLVLVPASLADLDRIASELKAA